MKLREAFEWSGLEVSTNQSLDEGSNSIALTLPQGETLFKSGDMFIEKFYPASHHIEVSDLSTCRCSLRTTSANAVTSR